MSEEPEIAIVVEGGLVQNIVTKGRGITCRVIDLDVRKAVDYAPDAENIDIEKYTDEMLNDKEEPVKFEDINDESLKDIFSSTKYNSMTIESDAECALLNSSNDEEFLQNWKSALHNLIEECQGVLKDLDPSEQEL